MLDFSKIADRVKDVDKNRFVDLKKETEMKLKMINVVECLCKKYASGLDKNKAEFLTNDAITITVKEAKALGFKHVKAE